MGHQTQPKHGQREQPTKYDPRREPRHEQGQGQGNPSIPAGPAEQRQGPIKNPRQPSR